MRMTALDGDMNLADLPGPRDFSQNVEREIPYLRRLAWRWYGSKVDRDDLVQDTLLRALANTHLWLPGSNLRAWLTVIMRNQFLTILEKSQRTARANNEYALDKGSLANDDSDARLMLSDVVRVVDRLPTRQRSAMIMVGVEGHSYEELARMTGVTVSAIRCDLARARKRLRTMVLANESRSPCGRRPPSVPNCQYAPILSGHGIFPQVPAVPFVSDVASVHAKTLNRMYW
jgi:RNA polymerase sigma-70 factor, ECF subfamily